MPMDEKTKATVRALLDRYPRGYVAEVAGISVTKSAAGLFHLLCVSALATDSAPSGPDITAVQEMFKRHWDSAPEMAKVTQDARAEVLEHAGYPNPREASRMLGAATAAVLDRYARDLNNLRAAAGGDGHRIRALLAEIPGMGETGIAVFLRDAQAFWPEAGPFLDSHAGLACLQNPMGCCATWRVTGGRKCSPGWPARSRSWTRATATTRSNRGFPPSGAQGKRGLS
jgi:hypothetical protein